MVNKKKLISIFISGLLLAISPIWLHPHIYSEEKITLLRQSSRAQNFVIQASRDFHIPNRRKKTLYSRYENLTTLYGQQVIGMNHEAVIRLLFNNQMVANDLYVHGTNESTFVHIIPNPAELELSFIGLLSTSRKEVQDRLDQLPTLEITNEINVTHSSRAMVPMPHLMKGFASDKKLVVSENTKIYFHSLKKKIDEDDTTFLEQSDLSVDCINEFLRIRSTEVNQIILQPCD